jgi:hypothetical protein
MKDLLEYNPAGKRKRIPPDIAGIIRSNIRLIINSTIYKLSRTKGRFYAKDVAGMVNKLKASVYRSLNQSGLNANPEIVNSACEYAIRDLIEASGE